MDDIKTKADIWNACLFGVWEAYLCFGVASVSTEDLKSLFDEMAKAPGPWPWNFICPQTGKVIFDGEKWL